MGGVGKLLLREVGGAADRRIAAACNPVTFGEGKGFACCGCARKEEFGSAEVRRGREQRATNFRWE